MGDENERAVTITTLQADLLQRMFDDRIPELNWDPSLHKELLLKLRDVDPSLENLNIGQLSRQLSKYKVSFLKVTFIRGINIAR